MITLPAGRTRLGHRRPGRSSETAAEIPFPFRCSLQFLWSAGAVVVAVVVFDSGGVLTWHRAFATLFVHSMLCTVRPRAASPRSSWEAGGTRPALTTGAALSTT